MLKEYQQTGSPELREKLIIKYSNLVRSAAVQMRGMASGYAQEEDLVNQGMLALMDWNDMMIRKGRVLKPSRSCVYGAP